MPKKLTKKQCAEKIRELMKERKPSEVVDEHPELQPGLAIVIAEMAEQKPRGSGALPQREPKTFGIDI